MHEQVQMILAMDLDRRPFPLRDVVPDVRPTVTLLFETAGRFHWMPQRDSLAEHVAETLPSPDPLLSIARQETGHRLITGAVQTYMQTAAGHLGALGVLYETGEVFSAPGTIVRGALESVARVFWILGGQQDEPEQRLARAYLEEFLSAEEAQMVAARMGGNESETLVARAGIRIALRSEILDRFPGASKTDLAKEGGRTLAGERLISPSAGVTSMFELFERQAGSTITKRTALGMYDFLSNATHPTLYPSRQRRMWVEHPSHPGEHIALERVEVGFLKRQAAVAVVAYYNALSYVTSYFGWSRGVYDTLTARIDTVLPGTLTNA
jgi:hypothetical protein